MIKSPFYTVLGGAGAESHSSPVPPQQQFIYTGYYGMPNQEQFVKPTKQKGWLVRLKKCSFKKKSFNLNLGRVHRIFSITNRIFIRNRRVIQEKMKTNKICMKNMQVRKEPNTISMYYNIK